MPQRIHLLIIDPQNSFCRPVEPDQQQQIHDGELCVAGAWEDMGRLAELVGRLGSRIETIHVTLDSHHLLHVAHPIWFRNGQGRHPEPFTIMRPQEGQIIGSRTDGEGKLQDVGRFTTTLPEVQGRTLEYLRQLAAGNRYPHCIWPPHCLIGTAGHNVVAPLMEALLDWCRSRMKRLNFVLKGSNPFVEHFSAVRAEVPDPDDPKTQTNRALIDAWQQTDEILLAGEAGSHCVANTVRDIVAEVPDEQFAKKCVLLMDGISPVAGFERYQEEFLSEMTARGMRTTTCADYAA
jgi:nicotinamidase-related amidase